METEGAYAEPSARGGLSTETDGKAPFRHLLGARESGPVLPITHNATACNGKACFGRGWGPAPASPQGVRERASRACSRRTWRAARKLLRTLIATWKLARRGLANNCGVVFQRWNKQQKPHDIQESLRHVVDVYLNDEVQLRNMLQALLSLIYCLFQRWHKNPQYVVSGILLMWVSTLKCKSHFRSMF